MQRAKWDEVSNQGEEKTAQERVHNRHNKTTGMEEANKQE
jgi:hypothetical protein